ncbi:MULTISPECIES: DUF3990 domain-containing protein [unclassified Planococcus (in: firmicutes)]|uniref:DUF3990 domain-containing protein n=1 Tax=unclassified Planococcus (in: firmicutes) TaxID=2662419 RepID=UPI000C3252B4|nr:MULTISPECIES: DUF3990 domain-containing protein [unclassified Planococcus (in: firmicutes)]AUD12360.1 hypothetical protein CW734_00330 [Planococcus sp. MB-3u-03]PKG46557.1 hypothetical protein CXF66_06690 [Planococcus sp. Urea-trap-24]PKG89757.1 hypothetical protein CXF91_06115 [Planococcus sp. Urea-3u-39]PKH40840.1 hypothetical protein CXF77_07280 [Planococcus sp. MB-3u-09]
MEIREKTKKILQRTQWYHGTTKDGFKKIMSQGVKFDVGLGSELDFGPGFYLAPEHQMAENFITNQINVLKKEGTEEFLSSDQLEPVIIEFGFTPYHYWENGELKVLDKFDREFASFVTENRIRALEGLVHDYPLVYGVMSDTIPTLLVSQFRDGELSKEEVITEIQKTRNSKRQVSIHRQEICDILTMTNAYEVDGGKELDINDYRNDK